MRLIALKVNLLIECKCLNLIGDVPAPGTYELNHFSIGKSVIKEEDEPELSPKRVGFNSGTQRFIGEKPKNEGLIEHNNLYIIYKSRRFRR